MDATFLLAKHSPDESMKSYAKCFSDIHSQLNNPNEKLAIQGFKVWIYDKHINLIFGSNGVRSFYGLLKEAQNVVDSQEAGEAFNQEP